MEKFFQILANQYMFKKLTTVFPIIKKEKLDEKDVENAINSLKREGIYDAFTETGQDPNVLFQITMTAFDESVAIMRVRLETALKTVAAELKKK